MTVIAATREARSLADIGPDWVVVGHRGERGWRYTFGGWERPLFLAAWATGYYLTVQRREENGELVLLAKVARQ